MGWPRVVAGTAARILSMVTDIATLQCYEKLKDSKNGRIGSMVIREGRKVSTVAKRKTAL